MFLTLSESQHTIPVGDGNSIFNLSRKCLKQCAGSPSPPTPPNPPNPRCILFCFTFCCSSGSEKRCLSVVFLKLSVWGGGACMKSAHLGGCMSVYTQFMDGGLKTAFKGHYYHVGSGGLPQVSGIGTRCLYPLSHLIGLDMVFLMCSCFLCHSRAGF